MTLANLDNTSSMMTQTNWLTIFSQINFSSSLIFVAERVVNKFRLWTSVFWPMVTSVSQDPVFPWTKNAKSGHVQDVGNGEHQILILLQVQHFTNL